MAASVALRIDLPMTRLASPVTFVDGVREHQDEVYGVALRITGDRDAALDVASSTFLKAYRAFDRYDQTRPLRHWLLRIATNEAITYVRKRGRELRRRVEVEHASALADPMATPDAESVAREDRARVRAAVATLPELYRVVIVLRYFNDLSVDEIAHVTGRPASTVGVQLLRGRGLLRGSLEAGR
ncbi:MAG: sigma-70 family RNA polymerase sigma factor [Chloroflexi bacterium]|nr:MAG: sigma-70 family RNA polymerase sigma factor [Chloroflexota bacterium]